MSRSNCKHSVWISSEISGNCLQESGSKTQNIKEVNILQRKPTNFFSCVRFDGLLRRKVTLIWNKNKIEIPVMYLLNVIFISLDYQSSILFFLDPYISMLRKRAIMFLRSSKIIWMCPISFNQTNNFQWIERKPWLGCQQQREEAFLEGVIIDENCKEVSRFWSW